MRILIKATAGSHLFGTNTESSDKDFKGVYLPSREQILLGTYQPTINHSTGNNDSRNSSSDIDVEYYSLKKFFEMLENGDTAALELLFTPDSRILEKDPLWNVICENRDKFLSKKITGMIGYARQQANKYGIKGSRMGELNLVIKDLKDIEKQSEVPGLKLKHFWSSVVEKIKNYKHVHVIELDSKGVKIPAIDILGKKFDHHCTFEYVLRSLKTTYKNYGSRAREAKNNNGVDWKALSHALRVMAQGIELLSSHKITLPLSDTTSAFIKAIKLGKFPYNDVQQFIESHMEVLETAAALSSLPDKIDSDFMKNLLMDIYLEQING